MSQKRKHSPLGFYHITCRGNSKQIIFEDDEDFKTYLKFLQHYKQKTYFKILAYCLMENHFHLVVQDMTMEMSNVIAFTNLKYAKYFNYKYERSGYVFQGRFKSKPIVDESQLLNTYKYVLKNPESAGICNCFKYKWSSINLYKVKNNLVETDLLESYFPTHKSYQQFLYKDDNQNKKNYTFDDNIYISALLKNFKINSIYDIPVLPKKKRNNIICYLDKLGASRKQIVRITGVSYGIVYRTCKNDKLVHGMMKEKMII